MVTPSIGQSADAARVVSDPQRTVRGERGAVPGALLPPIGGGIDHRVSMNTGIVGIGEIADPANHRSGTQSIASGTRWVVCPMDGRSVGEAGGGGYVTRTFDVEGTREGPAIAAPASTVGGEIVGLSGTRGFVRTGKVVATANETGIGGASVLGVEVRVLVG